METRSITILLSVIIIILYIHVFERSFVANGDISISAEVIGVDDGGGGGGGGIIPFPSYPAFTEVHFEGLAYPEAFISLLKENKIVGTVVADPNGNFEIVLKGVEAGTYNFGVFAEDKDGLKSVTLGFSVSVIKGLKTTVSGIYISPTIALSGSAYKKGEKMEIKGYSYPKSELNVFVSSLEEFVNETTVHDNGKWSYVFDTRVLEAGNHVVKAKSYTSGEFQSPFSETIAFKVMGICQGADLNFDGKVNLVDFSILLYYWGKKDSANICSDINSDKNVDLIDFSIMMYWWTG